jgi:3-isopropylmalate/(R)-2-methylmalate dehydratase large subunit
MSMNMIEKILAKASGRESVSPGEVVVARVDTQILHDLSGYITANVFDKEVKGKVKYPDRTAFVFDHHFSPPTEERARVLERSREFARTHGTRLYDCGSGNIHHVAVRKGMVRPGTVVVGSDSHTPVHGTLGCFAAGLGNNSHAATVMPFGKAWFMVPHTIKIEIRGKTKHGVFPRDAALWLTGQIGEGGAVYKALHFTGQYIEDLEVWDRWLFPLITIDVGGKCAFIDPDEKTVQFVKALTGEPFEVFTSDPGSVYEETREYDISGLEPQVAASPTLGNLQSVRGAFWGKPVQWAELGGHGGGRIEDFREAAKILRGRHIAQGVKFNAVPSSREVFSQALKEGLVETLFDAGASWFPPSAGSNQAINMGAMIEGEAMISTQARNFPGRNGSPKAIMYLSSASTVAASALKGCIADPREFL